MFVVLREFAIQFILHCKLFCQGFLEGNIKPVKCRENGGQPCAMWRKLVGRGEKAFKIYILDGGEDSFWNVFFPF